MPFLIVRVLRVRCVVTAAQAAHVVAHGDQIVLGVDFLRRIENELRQVEIVDRTVDEQIELVAIVPRVVEALELDDENLRQKPDVDLLRGVLQLFALRTVPLVVVGQRFFRGEVLEAVQERGGRLLLLAACLHAAGIAGRRARLQAILVRALLLFLLVLLDDRRRHVDDECRVRSIEIDMIIETRCQWFRRLSVVLIEDARGDVRRLVRRLTRRRRQGKEIRDRTLQGVLNVLAGAFVSGNIQIDRQAEVLM